MDSWVTSWFAGNRRAGPRVAAAEAGVQHGHGDHRVPAATAQRGLCVLPEHGEMFFFLLHRTSHFMYKWFLTDTWISVLSPLLCIYGNFFDDPFWSSKFWYEFFWWLWKFFWWSRHEIKLKFRWKGDTCVLLGVKGLTDTRSSVLPHFVIW